MSPRLIYLLRQWPRYSVEITWQDAHDAAYAADRYGDASSTSYRTGHGLFAWRVRGKGY